LAEKKHKQLNTKYHITGFFTKGNNIFIVLSLGHHESQSREILHIFLENPCKDKRMTDFV